jgi:peroxiredoxin
MFGMKISKNPTFDYSIQCSSSLLFTYQDSVTIMAHLLFSWGRVCQLSVPDSFCAKCSPNDGLPGVKKQVFAESL